MSGDDNAAEEYEPELGQAIFGQPFKKYAVSNLWEAALARLRDRLDMAMWNLHQEEYESPFNNTGAEFTDLSEFQVYAYSWADDTDQPFNFKWGDVEVSWYKHSSRGLSANGKLTPDLASKMLDQCLGAISKYEGEKMRAKGIHWP